MAHIEKQRGKYRARFADPLGRVQSRTFTRKADAERFLREVDADRVRGLWVDPRNAETPLAEWADEFPFALPAPVADDAGDLPTRSRQVCAAAVRFVPTRAASG